MRSTLHAPPLPARRTPPPLHRVAALGFAVAMTFVLFMVPPAVHTFSGPSGEITDPVYLTDVDGVSPDADTAEDGFKVELHPTPEPAAPTSAADQLLPTFNVDLHDAPATLPHRANTADTPALPMRPKPIETYIGAEANLPEFTVDVEPFVE